MEAYDGEINLGVEENMISNEFAVKLCLEHEVKRGNKVVKKELILVCRMGKSSKIKGKATGKTYMLENFYSDMDPRWSTGTSLTQKKPKRGSVGYQYFTENTSLLEEERPVIETMAYSDKYKKILDGICLDKMKLDGMNKEEEEAIIKVKEEALIEKDDPQPFYDSIRQEFIIGNLHKTISLRASQDQSVDTAESDNDDEEEYAFQRNKFGAPIYGPKPARLWEHTMMKPDHQEPNALDNTKPWRKYCSHRFIMNFWNGKVATEMRSQDSSTYEFDEVCADDELKTKKIIKFRLGGRAHSLTLLEFARRLGLYHAEKLDEEGFDVYFQGGLRSDDHFNAQEYWLSIKDNWRKDAGNTRERERESLIYCGQFITKLARKVRVLSDEVLRSLSAPIYCRDLDTTMLRELIDSEGRLILRFHSRMYLGLLSRDLKEHRCRTCTRGWIHMVGVYNVPLRGAYNPPGYDQQQYDQYYQQYPPQQQQ
ncbi:hypothetical protein Tco_0104836 [Tanacetum coccineum]